MLVRHAPQPSRPRRAVGGPDSPRGGSRCDDGAVIPRSVHDRDELAALLRRDPARHAYELGDLDDFFWPYTTWFRMGDAVALLYHGLAVPTLIALASPAEANGLLTGLMPILPRRFYAHLSPGADAALVEGFDAEPYGRHRKMALTDTDRLAAATPAGEVLGPDDLPDLLRLYAQAYPGNWFDRRMLETGHYVGVRYGGRIVAVAGVHVWSPVYRVAALGNVTTHPDARGQGHATAAVATLCRLLLRTVDVVTLNVKADNAAAVRVYERLGFTAASEYDEVDFTART
jgi:RimJ/RimL family protein N-acetyltransferase